MLWKEIISKSAEFLLRKGFDDGRVCVEELAACLLRTPRALICQSLDKEPLARDVDAMRRGVMRLAKGEPIQYIIKNWDFRSLNLKCDPRALIPRPETEGLAGLVIDYLRERFPAESEQANTRSTASNVNGLKPVLPVPSVIDVGTGTGAIILSIAKEYTERAILIATDVSEQAIALAKENASLLGLSEKIQFIVMDGLDDFEEPGLFDVLVSNPPYIESAQIATLDPRVRDYEPRLALDGGESGLDFYERYLSDALNLLRPGGAVFFEIGETQGPALERIFGEYGFKDIRIRKDLANRDRYASAVLE